MQTISTQKLMAKIERREHFHLIMAMSKAAYRRARIAGSIQADNQEDFAKLGDFDAEIVVYCTGPECVASRIAYGNLRTAGYRNVWHYPGGLSAWNEAGLPLETGVDR